MGNRVTGNNVGIIVDNLAGTAGSRITGNEVTDNLGPGIAGGSNGYVARNTVKLTREDFGIVIGTGGIVRDNINHRK